MSSEGKNYYEVLEVPINSSDEEIYRGYVRAKNAYSTDSLAMYSLMSEEECKSILESIEEAYSILGVPEKRKEYDKVRGFSNSAEQDFSIARQESSYNNKSSTKKSFFEEEHLSESYKAVRREAEVSPVLARKRFSLEYDKNPEFEQEIENCQSFTGDFLKKIREYKKVPIERMSDMTKISKTYIRYIEEDDFEKLPAPAYVRGFVFQYAKCLKITPELVATSYVHNLKLAKDKK